MTLRARRQGDAGFTVVELALVAGLLLLLIGFAYLLFGSGVRTERGQEARTRALGEINSATHRMTKEIRQALTIEPASTRSRLEMQTLIEGSEHRVVYEVVDGELQRRVDADPAKPIASRLTSAEVFCYDPPSCVATGPGSPAPSIIRITLALTPPAPGVPPVSRTTEVQLRNVGGG